MTEQQTATTPSSSKHPGGRPTTLGEERFTLRLTDNELGKYVAVSDSDLETLVRNIKQVAKSLTVADDNHDALTYSLPTALEALRSSTQIDEPLIDRLPNPPKFEVGQKVIYPDSQSDEHRGLLKVVEVQDFAVRPRYYVVKQDKPDGFRFYLHAKSLVAA